MKPKKTQKLSLARLSPLPAKPAERRYSIQSDGDHEYFVEVGNEGEFERWMSTFDGGLDWEEYREDGGYDYEKNRIDGRFTFTDPRNE